MRPFKLTMTAFGPYKQTEVINFKELEDHQLFVISGQTGSGKTTIFDGISFALYGSASGQDRENNAMLRSDFADDDVHTAVELIFKQQERRYRILRQLGHVKHGNKTSTGEKYEFFELVDGSEVPVVDRQMVSEINERVEQLIGLTQDQFKQIVMLPQGEFRKLLTSTTENKEQILRRLFKTETYEQISDRLRIKKEKVNRDFTEAEHRRDNYIHHISAKLPIREDAHLFQVLNEDHYNVNQLLNSLDAEIVHYKQQVKKDDEQYEKAYEEHGKQQLVYHQAKAVNERFQELAQKQVNLNKLEDEKSTFTTKEKQLQDAERANQITVYEQQVESWRKNDAEKKHAAKVAEEEQTTAEKSISQVKEMYEKEKNNEGKREEIRKQLDQLQQHLPIVKDIEERKQVLSKRQAKLNEQHEQLMALQENIRTEKEKNEQMNEQITKLDEAVSGEPAKSERLTYMREKATTIRDYEALVKNHATLKQTTQSEEQSFKKLQTKYHSLEQMWLANQASVLASHLHDGESCPVCGSHEHPQKASDSAGAVTRKELEQIKEAFDQQDTVYRNARANQQANERLIKQQAEKVTAHQILIDEAPSTLQKLITEGKKLSEEVEQLKQSRKKLADLKKQYEKTSKVTSELEKRKEQQEQIFQTEKTAYEREQAVFEERLRTIPENMRILSVLEEKINQTEATKRTMEKAWETIQKHLQIAEQQLTKTTTNSVNAHKQQKESVKKLSEAENQYHEAIKAAHFATEVAYKQAKIAEEMQEQLKQEIEQFKQNYSTLTKQVHELKKQLSGETKVNIVALEEQLNQLKKAYELAFNKRNESRKSLEEATELRTNINKADQDVTAKEKELAMITDLHDVTRGHNEQRISFERYLQIDYLEQIIEAANQRLSTLSNGQFLLQRSVRQEAYGRQSGLSLDVHDAYTGQTRDVKTLSGGEKFNASLCLALGMSDIIQSFQGNVAIDTMFINEGFGSLDEESLHKSIDTLIDLQETGRMIGVISHVQELKTIFPAVLQVQKTREGYSEANFIIK